MILEIILAVSELSILAALPLLLRPAPPHPATHRKDGAAGRGLEGATRCYDTTTSDPLRGWCYSQSFI